MFTVRKQKWREEDTCHPFLPTSRPACVEHLTGGWTGGTCKCGSVHRASCSLHKAWVTVADLWMFTPHVSANNVHRRQQGNVRRRLVNLSRAVWLLFGKTRWHKHAYKLLPVHIILQTVDMVIKWSSLLTDLCPGCTHPLEMKSWHPWSTPNGFDRFCSVRSC